MDQIKALLARLTLKQKVVILTAIVAVVAGLFYGVRWNHDRNLRPLFTNVSEEDSGALVEKLKAANVEYKVGPNGVILVPEDRVPELRLQMAAAGLPRTGRIGFELFDKTNLGTTEFAEQVNYRRALEGELERSVMAIAEVERARVHLTFGKDSVFLESRQPAKASVMIKLKPGAQLSQKNVLGITHLAASAVEGLMPEAVSVLDMDGNLLNKPKRPGEEQDGTSDEAIQYRQTLEKETMTKIRSTLDPLLGADKYRAGVSIECDYSSGEQSEEVFDPDRSVMVSSQKSEDVSGSATSGGVPGTASNLPRATGKIAGGNAGVSRRTENLAFQTSRLVKHVKLPQGGVKRISVAVLLDQGMRWEGVGSGAKRVFDVPSPERIKVVKDVIAGVIGVRQDRGDVVLVETLPFDAALTAPPPPDPRQPAKPGTPSGLQLPSWMQPLLKKAPLPVWIGAAACVFVVLLVGMFWFLRRKKPKAAPAGEVVEQKQVVAPEEAARAFAEKAHAQLEQNDEERERAELEVLAALKVPPTTKKGEVLRKHISDSANKDPEAVARLLRTWLNEQR